MLKYRHSRVLLLTTCISSAFIASCGSGGSSEIIDGDSASEVLINDEGDVIQTLAIDATAGGFGNSADDPANKWTYFNFDTARVVDLTDAQADESTDWHVAFKRVGVRINGGSSGPGFVSGALVDAQSRFFDENGEPDVSVFTAASAESEIGALEQTVNVDELVFETDADVTSISGDGTSEESSWWLYDSTTRTIAANTDVWNIVRGASGNSFAKLLVTDIQHFDRQISVEMFIQDENNSEFSSNATIWTAALGANGGSLCYDFEQTVQVDCTAQAKTWDLQLEVADGGRSWNMWSNGGDVRGAGDSGAAFGPLSTQVQADFVNADQAPTWFSNDTGGVFQSDSWYAYNIQSENKIWPNYRVYGIDAIDAKYKLQILSYYSATGVSGHLTIRFAKIEESTEPKEF